MKNFIHLLFTIVCLCIAVVYITSCNHSPVAVDAPSSPKNSKSTSISALPKYRFDGEALIRPVNYRRWIYVGTPLTPNDMNPPEAAFPEFHNVYIHPEDFDYWEKNGEWQDGTILVKELVTVGKKSHVSGKGYFQGEFTGLEATIKDKKRFPDEPGNWAYFSFGHSLPLAGTAVAFPTSACNSCHQSAAADDFVFTQDYPVLRAAKNVGNTSMGLLGNVGQPIRESRSSDSFKTGMIIDYLADK